MLVDETYTGFQATPHQLCAHSTYLATCQQDVQVVLICTRKQRQLQLCPAVLNLCTHAVLVLPQAILGPDKCTPAIFVQHRVPWLRRGGCPAPSPHITYAVCLATEAAGLKEALSDLRKQHHTWLRALSTSRKQYWAQNSHQQFE
jgi:hypothetical protein